MLHESAAGPGRLLRFVSEVLGDVDQGGTRLAFCRAVASVVGCSAVAHVWWEAPTHRWSVCRWSPPPALDRVPTTVDGVDETLSPATARSWWSVSECRRAVLGWITPLTVSEVMLPPAADSCSALVLGCDRWNAPRPPPDGSTLACLVMVERAVVRLEPPAAPCAPDLSLLSPRERQVLGLLSEGLSALAIGHRMGVSERTVHKHLGNIYRKLGVHDRLLAVSRAQALGLVAGLRLPAPAPASLPVRARPNA